MGIFKLFTHLLLLVTTPSLLIYPQAPSQHFQVEEIRSRLPKNFRKTERYQLISYDDILHLLNEIESESQDFRKKDWRRINRFLAYLANEGDLPNSGQSKGLYEDIKDLLENEDYSDFAFSYDDEYSIIQALNHNEADISLCKQKKLWKKTKSFVKKHKKEIIIGAVIVVAIATVVVAVVITSSAATAAAAVGAAGAASASKPSEPELTLSDEPQDTLPFEDAYNIIHATNETPNIQASIADQVKEFKDFLVEDRSSSPSWNDLSYGEKAREFGAYLAHQAYQELSELASLAPQLCQEVKDLGSKLLPEGVTPPTNELSGDPKENFENLISKGHRAIDILFTTDQAELFTEKRNESVYNFAVGMLPLPTDIPKLFANTRSLLEAGNVLDRAGFTKAGRGLMKHGYRTGSAFPKPVGNQVQINEKGQKVLESILNHPEKKLIPAEFDRYGKIVDIYAPNIGGARFSANGDFIGFLEP